MDRSDDFTIDILPPRGFHALKLRELWAYKDLWIVLSKRDIQIRYKQTVLGVAWAVLQPLAAMVIFSVFFGGFLQVGTDPPHVPYAIFVYGGILPWTLFAGITSGAAGSLVANTELMTKVYFPRTIIPLSAIGYALLDFLISSGVLAIMMIALDIRIRPHIALIPLIVLGILLFASGCGIILSALTVKYRDFRFVVPFLLQIWMFATPVIYPASIIPQQYQWLSVINPMTGFITNFRACFFQARPETGPLMICMLLGIITFLAGLLYFHHVEHVFADIA